MPSTNFTYTGGWQRFNVPAGVKILTVTLKGAGSGNIEGGYVLGKMRVDPADDLLILVGQAGQIRSGANDRIGGDTSFGGGGRGGDGTNAGEGGNGGGGASAIRRKTRDGPIVAVAGGAGGRGGDNDSIGGAGGQGGAETGEIGYPAGGPGIAESPTGGTQTQGGKGGTSQIGTAYDGRNGEQARLGRGGAGRGPDNPDTNGGGGGGGGWYPGGGGAAGKIDIAPATGGAGGANNTGGLYTSSTFRGGGGTGHGSVLIEWLAPDDPGNPPVPPQNITINTLPIEDGLVTRAVDNVLLRGTPDDPDAQNGVRLYVQVSKRQKFGNFWVVKGTYDETEERDHVFIRGLEQDTRYWLRIRTQDNRGNISENYVSTNFWMNRRPNAPNLIQPVANAQFTNLLNVTFIWNHIDPDGNDDDQTAFRLQYRTARTPIEDPGAWVQIEDVTDFEERTVGAGNFRGNTLYEWQVRTRDEQHRWGVWSTPRAFFVTAETAPPILEEPIKNEAVVAVEDSLFRWRFRSPINGVVQARADIRYRAVGADLWTTMFGDSTEPGSDWFWIVPADTFEPDFRYEWQARTHVAGGDPSDWSESAYFWSTDAPASGPGIDVIASGAPQSPLGVGDSRVFVYQRGGTVLLGEITPVSSVTWHRKRDDISICTLQINSWDSEKRLFLGSLRTWMHEIVVYRNGVRAWEGPITRIAGDADTVEIEAKDVMAYVYRRIMRQGYNDSYRIINGQQIGQRTVIERASRIIMNALAYDDPNVLPYLTPIVNDDDATTSRVVPEMICTAWEEVDDLAATAGLDYVCSGRRIILWDTHRPIGRLPEMRDGDFSDPPIVTEYGMSAANYFAVTDNQGTWGAASKVGLGTAADPVVDPGPQGWIEQLASAYGESEAVGTDRDLTREDKRRLRQSLAQQARRNIEGRWPPPVVARVRDNTTLSPTLNLGINQLVPGVWIPLRVHATVREVTAWQKLDSMTVTQDSTGEKISVVMSPAPYDGGDPDADAAIEETG